MFAKQGQKVSAKVNDVIVSVSFCHAAAPLVSICLTWLQPDIGAQTFLPRGMVASGLSRNSLTLESFE